MKRKINNLRYNITGRVFNRISFIVILLTICLTANSQHFNKVWSGGAFNPMTITVTSARINGSNLLAGDEIGIFDGTLCVGAVVLSQEIDPSNNATYIYITTSKNDGIGNGFTVDNTISYKFYKQSSNTEYENLIHTFPYSTGNFEIFKENETAIVALSAGFDPINITAVNTTNVICHGAQNGTITVTVSGGTPPNEYSIDNGGTWQASNSFNGLGPGNYNIKAKDSNTEIATWSNNPVVITEPTVIGITIVKTNVSISSVSDGSITITAIGGNGNYQYSIDGGTNWQASNSFTGLAAGSNNVFVIDENDCIKEFNNNPVNIFGGNTITDPRDGKVYKTVQIDDHWWMVENLAYLPSVNPSSDGSDSEPKYYVYGYEGTDVSGAKGTDNFTAHGVLYNWEASKTACPSGWNLPTDDEWKILEKHLGMSSSDADAEGMRESGDVGIKLKSTSGWYDNGNGDNSSGFNALPSGFVRWFGGFENLGKHNRFWSSPPVGSSVPYERGMGYNYDGVIRGPNSFLTYGFSVRCVKGKSINELVAYYPFNGNSNDDSGNGNDGTVYGAKTTTDRFGNENSAFIFDGLDDYISIPHSESLNLSEQISVSFWVKLETSAPYYFPYHIIEKYGSWGGGQRNWDIICMVEGDHSEDASVQITGLEPGINYHITLTFDGTIQKIFKNGILIDTYNYSGTIPQTCSEVLIGKYLLGGDYYFDGTLDDFRIFNRAISDEEIIDLFHEGGWETFSDPRDQHTYNIVTIGDQVWMAENLAYLPSVSPSNEGSETESYYYVNGYVGTDVIAAKATENYTIYGVLYNWEAAKIACPTGWYLPSDEEWTNLTNYLGNDAGIKMKSRLGWKNNGNGNNSSGFNALPGSDRNISGGFGTPGSASDFWSITPDGSSKAWYRYMVFDSDGVHRHSHNYIYGFSVRCLKGPSQYTLPTVTTAETYNITETTAEGGGNVTDDGGTEVTDRGVCWSTNENPTINSSLSFDGIDDYIEVPDVVEGKSQLTICSWIKPESIADKSPQAYVIIAQDNCFQLVWDAGIVKGFIDLDENGSRIRHPSTGYLSGGVIEAGIWQHVAMVYSGAELILYVNGLEVAKETGILNYNIWANSVWPTTIGKWPSANNYAHGHIDDIQIWERTLTQEEIQFFMNNSPKDYEEGLFSHWKFDEGNNNIVNDVTINNNDGIIHGATWSNEIPPIIPYQTNDGSGTGEFTSTLTNLYPGTTYYVRAYAINSVGTTYGEQVSFKTFGSYYETDNFTDSRDGHVYNSILIGTQWWMTQNLAYLPYVFPSNEQGGIWVYGYNSNIVSEANITNNYDNYGSLYDLYTALADNHGNGRDICPDGWHLPSDEEWKTLEMFLGMTQIEADKNGRRGTNEGGKLKEIGTLHWQSPNTGATNSSGFYGLPGGYRNLIGEYDDLGNRGRFWSSTDGDGTDYLGWERTLLSGLELVGRGVEQKNNGFSVRCIKDSPLTTIPTVTTTEISNITKTNADGGGNITDDGGEPVTARGVCWNTSGSPTISDDLTSDGTGTGAFVSNITGLTENTTYFVRAYATNGEGTAYGEQVEFATERILNTFTDPRDGNVYEYVTIGTQTWMAENLAYLPSVYPYYEGSDIESYYYVYGYEGTDVAAAKATENYTTYGVLFNWEAAKTACPDGWYLPTDEEWKTMEKYLGMIESEANLTGHRYSGFVGNKLKSMSGWDNNGNGTDSEGYKALPGGRRSYDGGFDGLGDDAYFWSSSLNVSLAWSRYLLSVHGGVDRYISSPRDGFSVRCLQAPPPTTPTVTTTEISNITKTTADGGGNITDDGGAPVTARGVCWNTSGSPTISDDLTSDGAGIGNFTSSITGLTPNTTYYYQAYTTNIAGTAYGDEGYSFITLNNDASLGDLQVDGSTIDGFNLATISYDYELSCGATIVPTVNATTNDPNASIVINNASSIPGTSTVIVTAADGTTIQTYSINFVFAEKFNIPDWTPPAGVQYSMTVHAQVTVYGRGLVISDCSLLAGFNGEDCIGVAEIRIGPVGKQFNLSLGANDDQIPGITFKVYDYATDEVLSISEKLDFVNNTVAGLVFDPLLFHAGMTELIIPLVNGWNWLSINTLPEDIGLDNVLQNFPGLDNDEIKTAPALGGSATYYSGQWWGLDGGIQPGIMYLLNSRTTVPGDLSVIGYPVDVSTPIPIVENWNWIGFNPQEPMDLATALASLESEDNDEIKTAPALGGSATYYNGQWWGLDGGLKPGIGYLLNSSKVDELIYPDGSISAPIVINIMDNQKSENDNFWTNPTGNLYTMTVHAKVVLPTGDFLEAPDSKLVAFKDNECRSVFEIFDGPAGYQFQLDVASDLEYEEDMVYIAYDAGNNKIYAINEKLDFVFNTTLGKIYDPEYLTIGSTLDIDEYLTRSKSIEFKLYPNPFTDKLNISFTNHTHQKVRVAIYGVKGQLIKVIYDRYYEPGNHNIVWDSINLPNGVYYIRLQTEGFVRNQKVVKLK